MGQTLDQSFPVLKLADTYSQLDPFAVVCLFGSIDPSFLSWVEAKEDRFVVFIEEDEALCLKAKTSPLAEHPRVRIFYFSQNHPELFKQIAWEFVFLSLGYFVLEGACQERAHACFTTLEHYHQGVDLLASEYKDRGVKVFSNALENLTALPFSKRGGSLEGSCKGMTAIICGAGPSLNAIAPLIKPLQDRALIIAGGSAIKALNAQGLTPHLIAAIDPEPSYERFLSQESFETPFFYQSRFSQDLLSRVQGPCIWMPSLSLIPLESYVLGECGLYSEPFDAGWTVANFCTALASHLGCERILFAGVDFVCNSNEVYASSLSSEKHDDGLIELQKGIYSRKDWLMSADWTRTFVLNHPSIEWGNLSSSTLDLLGVPLVSVESLFLPEKDMFAHVHALIAEAETCRVTTAQIQQVRSSLKHSFETSLSHCVSLLGLWQQTYPASPLEKPKYILIQHDLEQEICYEKCLNPLWEVWKYSILRTELHPLAKQLHRLLFFKQLIEIHLSYLRSY